MISFVRFNLYSHDIVTLSIAFGTMFIAVTLLLLPGLVASSREGNIHLLENEVVAALRSCSFNESMVPITTGGSLSKRSNDYDYQHKHDSQRDNMNTKNVDVCDHDKQNSTQLDILKETEDNIPSYGRTDTSVKYVRSSALPYANVHNYTTSNFARRKRNGYLSNTTNQDQCLSQCVFANLQVVDDRGIPRENELWNMMQTSLTSQQSRTVLKNQLRACFQELQSENDDNGCSYSNKLERCLMLRFSDRKLNDET